MVFPRQYRLFLLAGALLVASAAHGQSVPSVDARRRVEFAGSIEVVRSAGYLGRYAGVESFGSASYGILSAGAGLRFVAGTSQLDVHIAPALRLGLWWFYAIGGWAVEIVDRTTRYQVIDTGPFVSAGVAPTIRIGRVGRLGIDVGYEVFFPLWPDPDQPQAPDATTLLADWWLGTIVEDVARVLLPNGMMRLGLLYTFPIERYRMLE